MKKTFTILIAAIAAILMMAQPMKVWGQSDNSALYTSNVTMTPGDNSETCKVKIKNSQNQDVEYNGVKCGTSSKQGSVTISVPANTKYLHFHASAWKSKSVTMTVSGSYSNNISLTSNDGISGSSPYTFDGDPSTNNYYKLITFTTPLTQDVDITFAQNASSGDHRFVVWGVNAEKAHTITYSATNGSISGLVYNTSTAVASGAYVAEGGKVTLTAQPDDGYEFSSWEVSGTGSSLTSTTTNPTTFTMGTANATVTANFTASGGTTTYSVTYNPNGATSGTVPTDGNSYEANASVTVLGNTGNLVKTGNAFSGWCMNAEGTGTVYGPNNTATFNITANTTLYAKWTPYTITAASSNNNYGTVALNGNVISATPSEGYRVNISTPYSINPANSAEIVQNGNEFTVTPTANTTVTINFEAIPTYTASFSVNGTIDPANNCTVAEGAHITFPSNPAAISGKPFMGWYTAEYTNATTAPSYVNTTTVTMGNSNVTYYAVFADETAGTPVTDELTTSTFGSPSSYTSWSGKYDNSDARYAGQSSGGSNYIQIRATSPSGIVSTTSGGKATKVTVSWNSGTADNRTLDVYGKNTAYSDASDLYGNATAQGSTLGSLYYNVEINNVTTTTTELTITGNYKFIGLRSNSGAMYLDEIDIQWTPVTYANYSTSVEVKTITVLSYTGTPTKTTYSEGESFDPTGLTVTATYDDNSVENVTEYVTWTPDPLTQGTTSVTGTFMELTVNITGLTVKAAAGTETNPYTVAQAIANTPSSGTSSNVYIHGIVSAFYSSTITGDATYHRYYISDNGTISNQLLVFNGKKRSGTAFSDDDDIRVGDIVTIYGGLTTYNNTKEVAADNYIVSHKLVVPTLTPDAGAVLSGTTVAITDVHTTNTTIYYTTDGSTPTTSSTVYSTPISITTATTINAIAVKSGYTTSAVATAEYTILVQPTITVTADNPINVSAAGGSGELALTYANFTVSEADDFAVQFYDVNDEEIEDPDWITADVEDAEPSGYKVSYVVLANEGVARTAYFKVWALDGSTPFYSNKVTVTQAAVDYATLPFEFTGGKDDITNTMGLTSANLGSDYTGSNVTTKLKFQNNQNNTSISSLVLKLNAAPVQISYDIKGNSFSGGTFKVQLSEDGENYDDLAVYTTLGDAQRITHICNNSHVRYIKWIYTYKSSGNVGLGNIYVTADAIDGNNLTINTGETLTVSDGAILTLTGTVTNNGVIVIEDGGQLVTKISGITATVKKNVEEATNWGDATTYDADGWYFIASPVDGASYSTAMTTGSGEDYDLFVLDWANKKWLNKKVAANSSAFGEGFTRGKGYLYASQAGNTLSVAGTIQPLSNDDNATVTLANNGWNLIGNPLTCKVTVSCGFDELNGAASTTTKESGSVINPYQGIAVYGNAGDEVTFTKALSQNAATPSNNASLQMTLSQTISTRGTVSSKVVDNAIVTFEGNSTLPKFNMIEGNAKLFIPQNGEDYAIAFSDRQGDMPLNFKANELGTYTISFAGEEMDLNGIYLIDMIAEEEIDLSVDPSYTFIGSPADSQARFIIRFDGSENSEVSENSDIFAYQSGNDIIVSGEGELQIFDVMGRMIKTQHVSGVQTVNVNAQGVYIMKLNEKTQKIVVR